MRLEGLGGPAMEAAGVELLAGLDQLAVMGFGEIVAHLEFFRDLERRVRERVLSAGLVVLVDYPGLNLRIARAASEAGCPVLYYVPPKVWAWRPLRARKLAAHVDVVATILPFEVPLLDALGVPATFVGNPLLDRPDDVSGARAFRERWGLDPERPLLAVLPGSRAQELARHREPFLDALGLVAEARADVQPVVGRASSLPRDAYEGFDLPVVDDTRALLRHARAGLIKSGTSTLEAALEGLPHVVAYRTSAFSWAIVKRVLRVAHVSLPNLVAGVQVVPELIQDAMRPDALAEALLPLLDDGRARAAQLEGFRRIRALLGTPGAAARVADLGVELLEARR